MAGFDAVLVGSGINTLTAAALLARDGWSVCVIEQSDRLGLQIVRTLVEAELLGSIDMGNRDDSWGTSVRIIVPLRGRS